MKNLYAKISRGTLKKLSALFCFWGDLVICHFVYYKFSNTKYFDYMWNMAMVSYQETGNEIPSDMKQPIFQMLIKSLVIMMTAIVALHGITYLFYLKDKYFAHAYVKFLSFIGFFGAIYMSYLHLMEYPIHGALFILQIFLFAFVACGTVLYPWRPDYIQPKKKLVI